MIMGQIFIMIIMILVMIMIIFGKLKDQNDYHDC